MLVSSCLKSCLLFLCQRSQSALRSALKHSILSWHLSTSTGIYSETENTTATGDWLHLGRCESELQGSVWKRNFGKEDNCKRHAFMGRKQLKKYRTFYFSQVFLRNVFSYDLLEIKSWNNISSLWHRNDNRYKNSNKKEGCCLRGFVLLVCAIRLLQAGPQTLLGSDLASSKRSEIRQKTFTLTPEVAYKKHKEKGCAKKDAESWVWWGHDAAKTLNNTSLKIMLNVWRTNKICKCCLSLLVILQYACIYLWFCHKM